MPLRPTDTDALSEAAMSIALENYGFLYVDRVNDQVRSAYESADTSPIHASSISANEIKQSLSEVANDEFSELQRLRAGVYYYDPFGAGDDHGIVTELTTLFRQQLVVTSEELRSRFDLAIDDVDFFASELTDRNLLKRIATGERDYYTIGSRLKEQAGEAGVDARLREKATYGKLSHKQLEKVINVAATQDVIRYLETEGFVIDLDGEYLVESAIDRFADHLADQVGDAVADEFEGSSYVLPREEYVQLVQNEIEEHSDVLAHARGVRDEILEATRAALATDLGLEEDGSVVVQTDTFESFVDQRAESIKQEVTEGDARLATQSDFHEAGHPKVEDVQVGQATTVNEYAQTAIEERYDELVAEDFAVE